MHLIKPDLDGEVDSKHLLIDHLCEIIRIYRLLAPSQLYLCIIDLSYYFTWAFWTKRSPKKSFKRNPYENGLR